MSLVAREPSPERELGLYPQSLPYGPHAWNIFIFLISIDGIFFACLFADTQEYTS